MLISDNSRVRKNYFLIVGRLSTGSSPSTFAPPNHPLFRYKGVWVHCPVSLSIFAKGNNFSNFLFASLEDKAFQRGGWGRGMGLGLLFKERTRLKRSKSFPLEVDWGGGGGGGLLSEERTHFKQLLSLKS